MKKNRIKLKEEDKPKGQKKSSRKKSSVWTGVTNNTLLNKNKKKTEKL